MWAVSTDELLTMPVMWKEKQTKTMNTTLTKPKLVQTEIGKIPEDWEMMTLKEIGDIKMCKRVLKHQTRENGEIPFFKIGTFGKKPDAFISKELYNSLKRKYSFPKKGDVLISAAGTIGRTVVFDGKDSYYQDSNIVWIDNNEKLISNDLLYYVLQIVNYKTESGTIQRLYNDILQNTLFVCPPFLEQNAIATALSDTDAWIDSLKQLIDKKKAIKQGTMQELLTGQTRLKDENGNTFEGEWEEKKLGEIADFYKGSAFSKSDMVNNGKYKCIHYGQLFTLYPEVISNVISRTNKSENVFKSRSNDVLMPTSDVTPNGLATASCLLEDNVILGGDILITRIPKNILDGRFLSYLIPLKKDEIMQLVTGSTVFHIYGSDMKNFSIKYPNSIIEQSAIAQVLSDMDAEIEALEVKLEKAQKIKTGMMQDLLTGKIRLDSDMN